MKQIIVRSMDGNQILINAEEISHIKELDQLDQVYQKNIKYSLVLMRNGDKLATSHSFEEIVEALNKLTFGWKS